MTKVTSGGNVKRKRSGRNLREFDIWKAHNKMLEEKVKFWK